MMKQLLFALFLATVVLMVVAVDPKKDEKPDGGADSEGGDEGKDTKSGSSMITLATASLIGLTFNVLKNFWQ